MGARRGREYGTGEHLCPSLCFSWYRRLATTTICRRALRPGVPLGDLERVKDERASTARVESVA